MPKALITGITGQDGSYLAELLQGKGYEVHGVVRRSSTNNLTRLGNDNLILAVDLHYGDLGDDSIPRLIQKIQPDEVYNLAAMSHVRVSFDIPEYTADITGKATVRILESLRGSKCKFYQASSSEMFGSAPPPQNENTPFHPRSPYGCAKVFSYWATINYRESYGLHASNGILFNHESPRRGETFVTRKIAKAAARIFCGLDRELYLGNLDAKRDWGHAKDFVEAMWLMLQQPEPDDYVVATGQAFSVRDFCQEAFSYLGMDWKHYVRFDSQLLRPAEVDHLLGDPSKARAKLGWEPKVTFKQLVHEMVDSEIKALK